MPNKYDLIINNDQVQIFRADRIVDGSPAPLVCTFDADKAITDLDDDRKTAGLFIPYFQDSDASYNAHVDEIAALIDRYKEGKYLQEFSRVKGEFVLSLSDAVKDDTYKYQNCENVLDAVAAVLHFYASKGIKLKRCAHCGKTIIVFSRNGKDKYCTMRNSPMQDYKKMTCKQAVEAILKKYDYKISLLCKRAYQRANKNNPFYDPNDNKWKESDEAKQVKRQVKAIKEDVEKNPTPDNLRAFCTSVESLLDEAGITDRRRKA